jgi:alanine dehydrogenase
MTEKETKQSGMSVTNTLMLPKEEMLEIQRKEKKIVIGIPSDLSKVEYRRNAGCAWS